MVSLKEELDLPNHLRVLFNVNETSMDVKDCVCPIVLKITLFLRTFMKYFQIFSKELRRESKRLKRELRESKKMKLDEDVDTKDEKHEKEGSN